MDEDFDYFLRTFGAAVEEPQQPQPSDIEKYQGKLPARLLEYWKNYGWGGYKDGLFWIVNPAEFEPIVEEWLAGSGAENRDIYHTFARTAFGELFLWG